MTGTGEPGSAERMRIDKWLWAARFYKTRSLAAQAIAAGHVRLAGQAVKAARELHVGESLEIVVGDSVWNVVVRGLNAQRRPAPEAQQLYAETTESRERRLAQQEARRLAPVPGSDLRGRPTKKARRLIRGFNDNF
ncbi:MAG: Heat shock protein 15 [Candidatus Accumulibacter regalis]|jgi:ribosome-associated heat shock protein Hsp15|uniref:Heat shock protein 15 n=1 Tax=Accumulibacter regalis TaxID=522306 RepID=A0A011QEK7_ACCRE|nr:MULTISPECIES: RNA-binding S4 domain-containing protein [unclassified Candidatus Accumulibacter]EXI87485.1 MAG: Heat shock protein 15 [Candidatus Accumulibacter regalis]MBL8369518.1 RNA-binding S4 domain-containing protein [Accumulibacter sp.]HRE70806.1 RNA-binding S4 domain-containing protein [Accumulibacter sp.]HRE85906.1 RNA-binding S4 domain-containing protein [Accumulibacter sp.]